MSQGVSSFCTKQMFSRPRTGAAVGILHKIPLYHFFDRFVKWQIAQSFSRNFVQSAYCNSCANVLYY